MIGVRLHHVGVLVKSIPDAVPTYQRRYGYAVKSELIYDPVQTAYVQFLQLPGDSSYLELVSPDGPASKLANALKKGGGLNHVCYATQDIDRACLELRAQNMFVIQAPVPAVAFGGRRIAWLMGRDGTLTELVEKGTEGQL
jgi:methylmalonyl-CoA/ethylmalonyl-CoA epimerase